MTDIEQTKDRIIADAPIVAEAGAFPFYRSHSTKLMCSRYGNKIIVRQFTLESRTMLYTRVLLLIILSLLGGNALSQEIVLPRGIPPVQADFAKRHMTPLGKPCLTIEGFAKKELTNKNINQHWIRAANNCSQNIKVRICYYNTDDCILMSIPPHEGKDSMLGIFPALKRFQFEAKEQF